ncbi:Uncharacterised protein [uncultured archaeon]|nr:Uncharacterised protein [uncultured archaeon]
MTYLRLRDKARKLKLLLDASNTISMPKQTGALTRKTLVLAFTCLLLALTSSYASALANCAEAAFSTACQKCSFDPYGKIDGPCMDTHQNAGQACLASSYPIASAKYGLGMCPAVDACIEALKACKSARCPGPDKADCSNPSCISCYQEGDRCVARADSDCDSKATCGDKKCEQGKGETQETCCLDCNCAGELVCKDNKCMEPQAAQETSQNNSSNQNQPSTPEPTGPPQGLGFLWLFMSELVNGVCGGAPALMTVSIGLILATERRQKRN